MKTDEQIAKEYADEYSSLKKLLLITYKEKMEIVITYLSQCKTTNPAGFANFADLIVKAIAHIDCDNLCIKFKQFNDFIKEFGWYKLERGYYQIANIKNAREEPTSFEELYASKAFEDYLQSLKK